MAVLNPANTTMGDLLAEALKLSGRLGIGQTALAEDATLAWTYLQWMLQEWERKRWHVYRLTNLSKVSTGAASYTVGPAGSFSTGTATTSVRPVRIESAFVRLTDASIDNQPDFPVEIISTRQDYDRIRLKSLESFPSCLFYDPSWPLGTAYFWPIPAASIYTLFMTVLAQLPVVFATQADVINLPYEYYHAIVSNLAMRLRSRYGIKTFAGDTLPGEAKASLEVLRKANVAIPRLEMPGDLARAGGSYNIFSDSYS